MDEEKTCGAQLRRKSGKFCQVRKGLGAGGRCRLHGGKTPRGVAHPGYKHGARARYVGLPPRMRKDYQTALSDPALLELKHEIALVHARAADLVKRVDSGESGHLWQQLRKAHKDLTSATEPAAQLAAIVEMDRLINRGTADYRAWTEVLKTVDQKQRLVESERKRTVELHQTITLDALSPLMHAIIDYVRRMIPSTEGRMEFQRILETFAGVGTGTLH